MIKCVIWDLDNTIWDGILSESSRVTLRPGVMDVLSELTQRGIISSISSKNDYEVAMNKLSDFNIRHFFIYPQVSWYPKSLSIKKILDNLHFRAKNVLFVDDNEFEREEVKSIFPDITVNDGRNILNLLLLEGMEKKLGSEESIERINLYRLEEKRIIDSNHFQGNNNNFLLNCHIKMSINIATQIDINRIEELIDRTNQLNSTGIRFNKPQIIEMLNNQLYQIYVATIWDKYGSYGRSGLVIAKLDGDIYEIQLLIVSCRLMGKGIAQSLLAYFAQHAIQNKYRYLRLLFKRTKFNRQMLLLYTMNNLKKTNQLDEVDIYEIDLSYNKIKFPKWVTICKKTEII